MNRSGRSITLRVVGIGYLALLVGLPIGYLFIKAFGHGWADFWREVSEPGFVGSLELSLKVAAVVVPANTVAGIVAALLIARRRVFGRRLLDLAFDIPIAVSPIIVGVALVLAYAERTGWFGPRLLNDGISIIFTPTAIVIASMAVTLPYVLRSVVPVLVEVGEVQEQAARTLGASAVRRFFTITMPAIRSGLLYGVMITFARTLGEIGAVLIVSGNITGKTETAPIYVFDAWDQNYDALGAFSGAVVLAVISVVVLVLLSILRSRERRLLVDLT